MNLHNTLLAFTRPLLALSLLTASSIGYAQNNDLSVKLTLERASIVDGVQVMVPTERAAPGETLQYVVTYENTSHTAGRTPRALTGVTATLPIPVEMVFTGTSNPNPNTASLDGKAFVAYPIIKMVKQVDGSVKSTPADWAEYRALRWTLPEIASRKTTQVSASVQLNQGATSSASK